MPILVPRGYQIGDVEFMVKNGRALNANEPGLGKTPETLLARHELGGGPTLIVGPKSSLGVWEYQAMKWFNEPSLIYMGTPPQRRRIWDAFKRKDSQIIITNYKLLEEVVELLPEWKFFIPDEAHRGGLLNYKTDTFKTCKKLHSQYMYELTGTPVRRGPQDMWSLLHLLNPREFPNYWPFVNKWCIKINNGFGNDIEARPKDVLAFNAMVKRYMIRHLKKDVLEDLPDKQREAVPLAMSDRQADIYWQLAENMVAELPGGDMLITPNAATQLLRLRQLLVTPQILGIDEKGAALEALPELVDTEFDAGRAVMIGTPFKMAIPYIAKELEALNCHVEIIHGDIKELPNKVAQRFQNHPKHRKVLISTIQAAISFDAYEASTGFMIGYDWAMDTNKQCEDRLHRYGQRNAVFWKYLLHRGTADEAVMTRLDEKQQAENWILSPEQVLATIRSMKR